MTLATPAAADFPVLAQENLTYLDSAASICHGTMLEWCSISVSAMRSPSPTFARPHDQATRLSASVALRVKTVSPAVEPTKAAMRPRAPSKSSVASAASG